ncbi:MAG TPA: PD-(D/E)XK nuclease family protein [Candidatus Humimicrobiaceae bacterium]|nr:PD-(D/E)XK nuclease family protein [Candidatus Humimicrobiaceae bacterium]
MKQKRKSNLYDPDSSVPFNISRSKIDLFLECPRCFYLDRRLGVSRPDMPGWSLNSAVDQLLKNEFDLLRKNGESHKLMVQYKIDAIPFSHPDLSNWRDDTFRHIGANAIHKKTGLNICGIIDDIWINKKNKELIIVDYKATSTSKEISLEDEYKQGYKKQMEIYQWIFRQMGFNVSKVGYFLFANAGKNRPEFDGKLEFVTSILSYEGDDSWIDSTIVDIKKCLDYDKIPAASEKCNYCGYRELINQEEKLKKL